MKKVFVMMAVLLASVTASANDNFKLTGKIDGASKGNAFATYFHGIFHNYNFRREFLNYLRVKKGLDAKYGEDPYETQKDYSLNRLAEIVEENLDMDIIDKLLFGKK